MFINEREVKMFDLKTKSREQLLVSGETAADCCVRAMNVSARIGNSNGVHCEICKKVWQKIKEGTNEGKFFLLQKSTQFGEKKKAFKAKIRILYSTGNILGIRKDQRDTFLVWEKTGDRYYIDLSGQFLGTVDLPCNCH